MPKPLPIDLPPGLDPATVEEVIVLESGLGSIMGQTALVRLAMAWRLYTRPAPWEPFAPVALAAAEGLSYFAEGWKRQLTIRSADGRTFTIEPSTTEGEKLKAAFHTPAGPRSESPSAASSRETAAPTATLISEPSRAPEVLAALPPAIRMISPPSAPAPSTVPTTARPAPAKAAHSWLNKHLPIVHINASVVLVAIFCGPVIALLQLLVDIRAYQDLAIATVLTMVAVVAEFIGWKARVLYIPLWFVGLVYTAVLLFQLGGWWTGLGVGVSIAAALSGFMVLGYWADHQQWVDAPAALERARLAVASHDMAKAWKELSASFYVPLGNRFSPAMCAHNQATVELMLQLMGPTAMPEHQQAIERFLEPARQAIASSVKVEIESALTDPLQAIIRNGIARNGIAAKL